MAIDISILESDKNYLATSHMKESFFSSSFYQVKLSLSDRFIL